MTPAEQHIACAESLGFEHKGSWFASKGRHEDFWKRPDGAETMGLPQFSKFYDGAASMLLDAMVRERCTCSLVQQHSVKIQCHIYSSGLNDEPEVCHVDDTLPAALTGAYLKYKKLWKEEETYETSMPIV
jgi:hypothetical protein